MEVVKGFLLDGIDGQCTGLGIDLTDEHTIMVTTTATTPCPVIGDMTMVRTELAFHGFAIQLPIIPTLHQNTIAS